jgi:hypothetical protein
MFIFLLSTGTRGVVFALLIAGAGNLDEISAFES